MIVFRCPGCSKKINAKPTLAGRELPCPGCGHLLQVPNEASASPIDQAATATSPAAPAPNADSAINPVVTPEEQSAFAADEIGDIFRLQPLESVPAVEPMVKTEPHPFPSPAQAPLKSATPGKKFRAAPHSSTTAGWLNYSHWLLLLAFVPLAITLLTGSSSEQIENRIIETFSQLDENTLEKVQAADKRSGDKEVFQLLPDNRIIGALLARDTLVHWLFAILSAGLFMGLLLLMNRDGGAKLSHLLMLAAFTATGGIALLLMFQYLADYTQGVNVRGRGIGMLIFYIVKFIGFSYRAASNPENGFWLSMIGYTCGVGLCEEVCKALPILAYFKNSETFSRRTAMLWGMASGIGFGVAEGIVYSQDYYNGIHTGEIYLVRFLSCVALHGVWSAVVAMTIYSQRHLWQQAESSWEYAWAILVYVAGPMVIHGLYDTLLKQHYEAWALVSALASFGLLVVFLGRGESD